MYTALNIAKYIIRRCNNRNKTISNLKLQKILYFVQAEFLVALDEPCFYEKIEAWDFGPVVPDVYHEYKKFGSSNIPVFGIANGFMNISNKYKEIMNGIIDECSKYSASDLVDITHHQSPWIDAYNKPGVNNEITIKSIRDYFIVG